jgi:hypothetical protein
MIKAFIPILATGFLLCGCVHNDQDMTDAKLPPGAGQPRKPSAQEAALGNAEVKGAQKAAASNGQMMQQMAQAMKKTGGR